MSRDVMAGLAVAAWMLVLVVLGSSLASGDWPLFVFLLLTVPPLMGAYVWARRRG